MTSAPHYEADYYRDHYRYVIADQRAYKILSLYWREVLLGADPQLARGAVLDYGCGLGQVSAALPDVTLFDPSAYAADYLRSTGRRPVERAEEIPERHFDTVLSSHSLEHSPHPAADLRAFARYVKPGGHLVLALPVEINWKPSLRPDTDQHFHCWTFQTITNLLLHCGWTPIRQKKVYGPFLLRTSSLWLPDHWAVRVARALGRVRRLFPTLLVIARRSPEAGPPGGGSG